MFSSNLPAVSLNAQQGQEKSSSQSPRWFCSKAMFVSSIFWRGNRSLLSSTFCTRSSILLSMFISFFADVAYQPRKSCSSQKAFNPFSSYDAEPKSHLFPKLHVSQNELISYYHTTTLRYPVESDVRVTYLTASPGQAARCVSTLYL